MLSSKGRHFTSFGFVFSNLVRLSLLCLVNGKKQKTSIIQEKIRIQPKNPEQHLYSKYLNDERNKIVVCTGCAGTGKTLLSLNYGIERLRNNDVDKLILTRPTVCVDNENLGFLPGKIDAKIQPFMNPYFDIFGKEMKQFIEEKRILMMPLAYMRGLTFNDCVVIADEMENSTPIQMKMLLTRIGENGKILVTGDLEQSDIYHENGLQQFISILDPECASIKHLTLKKIERSPIITQILDMYNSK